MGADKKHNLFITAVSGYFGMKLVKHFSSKDDAGRITGIDINEPEYSKEAFMDFVRHARRT